MSEFPAETQQATTGSEVKRCMQPDCSAAGTKRFVGRKPGREPLTYRTCPDHEIPVAMGLIRLGLAQQIYFTDPSERLTSRGSRA